MPHKLLLADDSVTIQRVIELTFADEDVSVTAVGDGKQAIERIEAEPPDIVLADVGMPEKDGYEVADFVKRTPRLAHIPVLLLTGAFEPVDEERAVRVGCDGVLAKPFEPQMVITRVRELLSSTVAATARPTPQLVQPPPARKLAPRSPDTGRGQGTPAPEAVLPPPEPLPPAPPPPLSAGPTPVVPLPVATPPRQTAPLPAAQAAGARAEREIEVRLPGRDSAASSPAPEIPPAGPGPAPAPMPPVTEPARPNEGRSPEEIAVESALDAAIRIRRRPPVAVPEIGVPPKGFEPAAASGLAAMPKPEPDRATQLDDYFERLDAAMANFGTRERRPPPAESVVAPQPASTPGPAPEPAPTHVAASRGPAPVVPALEVVAPALTPEAEPASRAEGEPETQPPAALAQAFSVLLDAERGEPGTGPLPSLFPPPAISPALREELVEQVTRRVLERLSDRVVRETVTDLVSRVTERLVREEIERLKTTIK
ncbi:MAG: response regulator [Acidobacteriota bacterium]